MVATLTDKIGTEAEEIKDKVSVMKLYNKVPRVFESEVIVRLPYCNAGTIQFNSGMDNSTMRTNSIYDPDVSGDFGDLQPLGRDFWSSAYNYYKVLKSHFRVDIMDLSNYNTQSINPNSEAFPSTVGGLLNITGTIPSTHTQWLMGEKAGNSNRQQLFTRPVECCIHQGTQQIKTIEMEWNPTLFETSIIDQSTKDTWTPVGSNPDNVEWFNIVVNNPSATVRRFYVRIQVEYMVAFKQVNEALLNTIN